MAEVFLLLFIGGFMLPCVTGSVEAINYNIFHRHASAGLVFTVWISATVLSWLALLAQVAQ